MLVSLAAFAVAATLIVLLPGPDTLVTIRGLLRSRRQGALTAVGVNCGLAVWVCAAALGLSALLQASEVGYDGLKIAGALYLVYLGVQSWRTVLQHRRNTSNPAQAQLPVPERSGLLGSGFFAGLLTDLLNPKVGVFMVSFLPGFIPHGYSVGWTTLLLGVVFVCINVIYFTVMVVLAGRITRWIEIPRIRRRMDAITGSVLVGFGIRLALES